MFIKDFIDKNKDLSTYKRGEVTILHENVVTQALRHTTNSDMDDLQSIARPSEEKIYVDWRKSVLRSVTPDYTMQFVRMMQRVLSQTINVNIDTKLSRYVFDRIIPLSIQDPNAKIVTLPYIKGSENIPPSSSDFLPNMALDKERVLVYSAHILYSDDSLFIYYRDHVLVDKNTYPRYVAIDTQGYYILEPKLDQSKKIYYEPILWYLHKLGILPPIAEMPGNSINTVTIDKVTKRKKVIQYKESICWGAFEWFDEGAIRFSSEQAGFIKYANPKLIMRNDMECPTCIGSAFVSKTLANGLPSDDPKDQKLCPTCNGKRKLTTLGDFSTINLKSNGIEKDINNPVYYLTPPAGLKELEDSYMHKFDMGKMALFNDPLEGKPGESGIAKELRLEPKQDLLKSYGQQLCYLIEDLVNCELLLDNKKELVTITPPIYYQTKSPEVLKLQVQEASLGEKYLTYMAYLESMYRGDEATIKSKKFAYLYCPLVLYKDEEITTAFNTGRCDERDLVKKDYAYYAVDKVLEKEPKLEDLKIIIEKCDQLLIDEGILKEESETINTNIDTLQTGQNNDDPNL